MRGVLQPLIERRTLSDPDHLAEAVRLAEPAAGDVDDQDPLLGVAANALGERRA